MNKLLHSNKGNITIEVIIISLITVIFTLPVLSLLFNSNIQSRKQIQRVQYFYNLKADLTKIQGALSTDIEFLHNNPSGIIGTLNYTTVDEAYINETEQVFNSETGLYDDIIVASKYTYDIDIDRHTYKISSRIDLTNNQIAVKMVN